MAKQLFNSFAFGMFFDLILTGMLHSSERKIVCFLDDFYIDCPADVRDVRGVALQVTRLEAVGSGQSLKGAFSLRMLFKIPD